MAGIVSTSMRQSTRLILNTLVTYARMALTVGLGLAVTRLALQQLGASDYGTLSTLGASGVLLLVLSDALTASTQRHLAFEIGREDRAMLRCVFNTALLIYGGLGVVAAGLGTAFWPLLRTIIEIPEGRESSAVLVYMLTLATIVSTVLATPYRGFLMAKQSFVIVAVYDLVQSVLGLAAVLVLFTVGGDKLISYAWLLLGVRLASEGVAIGMALVAFPDCRPRPLLFRRNQIRRIASFAGWSLFVLMAWRLRVQGSTILLNSYYGSGASAAYGVATQLGGYQNQVGAAVWRAVRPAMTTIEARGGAEGVRTLTLVSSKYLMLLTLFFFVPVELEMEQVLDVWLESIPPFTTSLTRLVLVWTAMNWVSIGFQMAMEAKGNLGRYALLMGCFDAAVLVVQIVALGFVPSGDNGRPAVDPWIMPTITIAIVGTQNVVRSWYVGIILGVPLRRWVSGVLWPCALVGVLGGGAAMVPFWLMPQSLWRLLAVASVYGMVALPSVWFLAMDTWEREHFARVGSGALGIARRLMKARTAASDEPGADVAGS